MLESIYGFAYIWSNWYRNLHQNEECFKGSTEAIMDKDGNISKSIEKGITIFENGDWIEGDSKDRNWIGKAKCRWKDETVKIHECIKNKEHGPFISYGWNKEIEIGHYFDGEII